MRVWLQFVCDISDSSPDSAGCALSLLKRSSLLFGKMATAPATNGLARMRRVPRRSTDSTECVQGEKLKSQTVSSPSPSAAMPQIVEASIRSIPQTAFIHTASATPADNSVGVNSGAPGLPLSILTTNKELSIRPVDVPALSKKPDNDVQFVRCAKAVATQTVVADTCDGPAESQQAKRPRISHSLGGVDQPDLLRRIVELKEEKLAVEKEKLKTLRQLVACFRGANGSTSGLPAVFSEK